MDTTAGGMPDTARAGRTGRPAPPQQLTGPAAGRAVDAAGMAVLACCAVWALICAAGRDARPEDTLLALLAVTSGYAAGRVLGALLPVVTPAVGAAVVLALVLVPPSRLGSAGHAPPLGDPAADAALLVLATGAACCAAWGATRPAVRAALLLAAAGAAVTALALGYAAGAAACAATLLWSLAAGRTRHRAAGLVSLALVAALMVGASYAVAVNALPSGLSGPSPGSSAGPGSSCGTRRSASPGTIRCAAWGRAASPRPASGCPPTRRSDRRLGPRPSSSPRNRASSVSRCWPPPTSGPCVPCGAHPRPTPVVLTAAAALTGLGAARRRRPVLGYAAVTASAGLLTGLADLPPAPTAP